MGPPVAGWSGQWLGDSEDARTFEEGAKLRHARAVARQAALLEKEGAGLTSQQKQEQGMLETPHGGVWRVLDQAQPRERRSG